jgi:hypothetical protein
VRGDRSTFAPCYKSSGSGLGRALTNHIAGWLRFFTLSQCGDVPLRYGRSQRLFAWAVL